MTAFHYLIRLFGIIIAGALITLYFPTIEVVSSTTLSASTMVVIVFIFLAGFLINQAIQRDRALKVAISIELSRLRRIVHLTENCKTTKAWKDEVRLAVVSYLESVGRKDFRDYDEGHHAFRGITHLIYEFSPKTKRDEIIFSELLTVTRELAYQRQQVAKFIFSPISRYTKIAATFVAFIAITLLLGARAEEASTFFIAGPVSSILLILDIFFNLDVLTKEDRLKLQEQYLSNAQKVKVE